MKKFQNFSLRELRLSYYEKQSFLSKISHRYAKANNKYLKDYDKSKKSTYIIYLDANNLYGWAMQKKLPKNNFKYSSKEYRNKIMELIKNDKYCSYVDKIEKKR